MKSGCLWIACLTGTSACAQLPTHSLLPVAQEQAQGQAQEERVAGIPKRPPSWRWYAGGSLLVTAYGLAFWDWGSSGFHLRSEGWLSSDTRSGGADKFGHAWFASVVTAISADHFRAQGHSDREAALRGALSGVLFSSMIELGDGFSAEHGFSWEDQAFNLSGVGLEYLRQRSPWVRERVHFRWEWAPSRAMRAGDTDDPSTDYSGSNYLLAFPLRGWGLTGKPWRWLEVQTGYFTRGYGDGAPHYPRARESFVGVGFDLTGLLQDGIGHDGWSVLRYFQPRMPGLALRAD